MPPPRRPTGPVWTSFSTVRRARTDIGGASQGLAADGLREAAPVGRFARWRHAHPLVLAEAAKASFRVFADRVEAPEQPDGYAVPHTAITYLLGPNRLAHFSDAIIDDD